MGGTWAFAYSLLPNLWKDSEAFRQLSGVNCPIWAHGSDTELDPRAGTTKHDVRMYIERVANAYSAQGKKSEALNVFDPQSKEVKVINKFAKSMTQKKTWKVTSVVLDILEAGGDSLWASFRSKDEDKVSFQL